MHIHPGHPRYLTATLGIEVQHAHMDSLCLPKPCQGNPDEPAYLQVQHSHEDSLHVDQSHVRRTYMSLHS